MSLKKVQPGDPLDIPAATFNTFIDVARGFQGRQRNAARNMQRDVRHTGIVLVRNDSGTDRNRFDVLGILGPIFTPNDNPDTFKERVALRGVTPTADHAGRFVILLQPLPIGAIGRAYIDGSCVVRVKMANEDHRHADVKDSDAGVLLSSAAGAMQLLWIQPESDRGDPTIAWTVARFGGAGGGEIDAKLAKVYQLGVYPEPYLRVHAVNHLYEPVGEYFDVGVFAYNFIDWDHTHVPLEADYLVPIVRYGFTEGPGGAWYLGFPIVGVCDPPVSV